jgi:regulator of protease activity HflC (stomatin/prohibitin superfamily)
LVFSGSVRSECRGLIILQKRSGFIRLLGVKSTARLVLILFIVAVILLLRSIRFVPPGHVGVVDIFLNLLKWKGIEATRDLANSSNSKVVIIGSGKEGLPVILGGGKAEPTRSPAARAQTS